MVRNFDSSAAVILTFEHPTLAGNQVGGWMPKLREHPLLTAPGIFINGPLGSAAFIEYFSAHIKPEGEVARNPALDSSMPSFSLK